MASTAFKTYVNAIGVEKAFYAALKTYITGLDTRITCANDPDTEFDISTKGDDYVPKLEFSINNSHAFTIYRNNPLGTNTAGFNVKMDISASIPENTKFLYQSPTMTSPRPYTESIERGTYISHIIDDNFIYISFIQAIFSEYVPDEVFIMVHSFSSDSTFVTSAAGEKRYVRYTKPEIFNISGYTFYDKAGVLAPGTFLSRFTYAAPAGQIDYIKSCIYQSSGEKVFENRAIYDSTTVTVGDTVSLKDGSYVAVGAHQLVKVS